MTVSHNILQLTCLDSHQQYPLTLWLRYIMTATIWYTVYDTVLYSMVLDAGIVLGWYVAQGGRLVTVKGPV